MPSHTVYIKSLCGNVTNITCTRSGVTESNRVTSFTSTSVTFTANSGTFDYEFILTHPSGDPSKVTFKNVVS